MNEWRDSRVDVERGTGISVDLLVRYPRKVRVMHYVDVIQSAFLEAGGTLAACRRKGVAAALIREAERVAREQGYTQIGLEVGSTENPAAKRLYEHLGYVEWGHDDFPISWEYIDSDDHTGIEIRDRHLICTNLSKHNSCTSPV